LLDLSLINLARDQIFYLLRPRISGHATAPTEEGDELATYHLPCSRRLARQYAAITYTGHVADIANPALVTQLRPQASLHLDIATHGINHACRPIGSSVRGNGLSFRHRRVALCGSPWRHWKRRL